MKLNKFLLLFCFTFILAQDEEPKKVSPPAIGNYALPVSQRPGEAFSFGQYIVEKGDLLWYQSFTYIKGECEKFLETTGRLLYGISNKASIYLAIPVFIEQKENGYFSNGISDINIEFEYAFHQKSTIKHFNQATIVVNMSFPSGSVTKTPITGFGNPAFFLGTTATHLGINWYCFGALGGLATTERKGTKIGSQFHYHWGVGHNLGNPLGGILFADIEFIGIFTTRSKFDGIIDCNSGGNIVTFGPSFYFATEYFALLGGIHLPLEQHPFGKQNELQLRTYFELEWKF